MNNVILSGFITRNPEAGSTKNEITYCKFGIAVQRSYKDANGERGTDFFNCTAWRNTAEYCCKYLEKGSRATLSGRLAMNEFTDSNGVKRQNCEIVVEEIEAVFAKKPEDVQNQEACKSQLKPVEDELPF